MISVSQKKTITVLVLMLLLLPLTAEARGPVVPFEREGKWGYADADGKAIIEPRYRMAKPFSPKGIAAVMDEGGWAYINRKGDVLVRPFIFDNGPDYFSEGLARYTEKGRFGFFDERGRIKIRARFDFARPFHGGMAAACVGCRFKSEGEHTLVVNGKWGFIDRRGRWAIRPAYESAGDFQDGRATVNAGGKQLYLDGKGTAIPSGSRQAPAGH